MPPTPKPKPKTARMSTGGVSRTPGGPQQPPPAAEADGVQRFEVESILSSRVAQDDKGHLEVQYETKWVGWGELTWEPAESFEQAQEILEAFVRKGKESPAAEPEAAKSKDKDKSGDAAPQVPSDPKRPFADWLRSRCDASGVDPTGMALDFEAAASMLEEASKTWSKAGAGAPPNAASAPAPDKTLDEIHQEFSRANHDPEPDIEDRLEQGTSADRLAYLACLSRKKLPSERAETASLNEFFDEDGTDPDLSVVQLLKAEELMDKSPFVPRPRNIAQWSKRWNARSAVQGSLSLRRAMVDTSVNVALVAQAHGWKFATKYLHELEKAVKQVSVLDVPSSHAAALIAADLHAKAAKAAGKK